MPQWPSKRQCDGCFCGDKPLFIALGGKVSLLGTTPPHSWLVVMDISIHERIIVLGNAQSGTFGSFFSVVPGDRIRWVVGRYETQK
jgi:hypothetical protein